MEENSLRAISKVSSISIRSSTAISGESFFFNINGIAAPVPPRIMSKIITNAIITTFFFPSEPFNLRLILDFNNIIFFGILDVIFTCCNFR